MERHRADRLLGLALAKGLITLRDLGGALPLAPEKPLPAEAPSAWLESLVTSGKLDVLALKALEKDLDQLELTFVFDKPSGSPAGNGPDAPADSLPERTAVPDTLKGESGLLGFQTFGASLRRFEIIEALGSGGMGTVCRAYEHKLKRYVAVKFLRSENAGEAERFAREAQAQARLDHENICKVFDVGETDGKPFIVMQLIEGRNLRQLMPELRLEEKVHIVEKVAEALQAAHRAGLIHRDIKPGNIMVEKTPGGGWKPYVLDFGLVHDQEAPGSTKTGMIMGTPMYMAPEQASGKVHQLDRRTDVYSLGAVLYELLAGQPPFQGDNELSILMKVLGDDPAPVRQLAPHIPADLETIARKCLEKLPQDRYDSARALADDLARYRNGEPILARPASWSYLALKKVRKHRALFATSAVFLLVLLVLVGIGLRGRMLAAERAALAQQFGQEVEQIEGFLHYIQALPLHDTRREIGIVRDRMRRIEERMRTLGDIATGPGHYALGRGHLALRDHAEARRHLEKAWSAGARGPEVAYALGLTLGEQYQAALDDAQRIANKDLREVRLKQLEQKYRGPALAYLRLSRNAATLAPAYAEGLIAFYDRQYQQALQKADDALGQAPWLSEAARLRGQAFLYLGAEKQNQGDLAGARALLDQSVLALERAVDMARSDSEAYERMAACWLKVMEIQAAQGQASDDAGREAAAAIDRSIPASPDRSYAYYLRALWNHQQADTALRRGLDPSPLLEQTRRSAREALRLNPSDPRPLHSIGTSYLLQAMHVDLKRGRDPRPSLDQAADSFGRVLKANPGYLPSLANRGSVFGIRAEYEFLQGADPVPSLDLAGQSYRQVLEQAPDMALLWNNLGNIYYRMGEYQQSRGRPSDPSYRQAIDCCQKAVRLNSTLVPAFNLMGACWEGLGRAAVAGGGDPRPMLENAQSDYRRALAANPKYIYAINNLGLSWLQLARYAVLRNEDPKPLLRQSASQFEEGLRINATFLDEVHYNYGDVRLLEARLLIESGQDPSGKLEEARRHYGQALQINPRNAQTLSRAAQSWLLSARWALGRNASARASLSEAGKAFQQAVQLNQRDSEIFAHFAEFYRWQAEADLRSGAPATEAIAQGQARLTAALALNPANARAVALQGVLAELEARAEKEAGKRGEALARARQSIEAAMRVNPLLGREFGPILERVRK